MKQVHVGLGVALMLLCISLSGQAQQSATTAANGMVPPPLIQFSNVAIDEGGNTLSGVVSITFSLYNGQQGGEPLWTETQNNVQLDSTGHYSVQLGITKPNGVPTTLFTSGEARWLGVQIAEQVEQPRILLLSVPYALKAGDAATIGGLPPSAFVLAAPQNGTASAYTTDSATGQSVSTETATDVTTTGGTANYLPLFNGTSTIIDSVLFQSGTGSTAKIGVNTTTPATTLDVKGGGTIRGSLTTLGTLALPATGAATATAGKNSEPLSLAASAFNSTSSTAVNQSFQWQAEPAANDTTAPSGTLNLLFGEGTAKPSETGLKLSNEGIFTFAAGQTFPTVTGNETVTGNISSDGSVNATTSFDIGGTVFAFGSASEFNAFLGFAGNSTMTGNYNTATGSRALAADTTGSVNVASGYDALASNTTGSYNVASGQAALYYNTTGNANTGIGNFAGLTADLSKLTGQNNTALGTGAAFGTGSLTNATAIGANAEVTESNALVLGSINGVNGQTVSANVGIGTTAPAYALDVRGTIAANTLYAADVSLSDALSVSSGEGSPLSVYSSSTVASTIEGVASAATGEAWGVYGLTYSSASDAYGLIGDAFASSGSPIGVYGWGEESPTAIGVFGQNETESTTGSGMFTGYTPEGVGVWGDGGKTSGNIGVIGSVDDGVAGQFVNNSSAPALIAGDGGSGQPFVAESGLADYCYVDSTGDLYCSGSIYAQAFVTYGGARLIVGMSAIESPKNWFEDAGSAQLVSGAAVVALDPTFIQTVNTEMDYKVFPVPNGDCKGLYVTNKTASSFEVRELGGGVSNIRFDYRIMALRKNYENVRFSDHTHDMDWQKRRGAAAAIRRAQPQSHDPRKNLPPAKAASLKPASVTPVAR